MENFFGKIGKNFNKTIFLKISKQVEINLIEPSGRKYLVTSRKFFKLAT